MACEHDLAEMDTAAHWDGICPGAPEIEVTPEMVEAGLHHLLKFNPYRGSDDERTVGEIFRAMERARKSERLCMNAEVEKLRAAIAWALGEQPDAEGRWFGEAYDEDRARYGWRKHLRKLAGLPTYTYDKASRTILRSLV
jgi:hypothetical protein